MTTDECEFLVCALVDYWKPRLGLHSWSLYVHTSPRVLWEDGIHYSATAVCTPRWKYLEADLRFATDVLIENGDILEEVVVHELMHVVLAELDRRDEHEERVATLLARALIGQYA